MLSLSLKVIVRSLILILALVTGDFSGEYAIAGDEELNQQNRCAEYKLLKEKINQTVSKLIRNHKDEIDFVVKMKRSQDAWILYANSLVDSIYPEKDKQDAYGSVYDFCKCDVLIDIAQSRMKFLEQWTIGIKEGDVCVGSRETSK